MDAVWNDLAGRTGGGLGLAGLKSRGIREWSGVSQRGGLAPSFTRCGGHLGQGIT